MTWCLNLETEGCLVSTLYIGFPCFPFNNLFASARSFHPLPWTFTWYVTLFELLISYRPMPSNHEACSHGQNCLSLLPWWSIGRMQLWMALRMPPLVGAGVELLISELPLMFQCRLNDQCLQKIHSKTCAEVQTAIQLQVPQGVSWRAKTLQQWILQLVSIIWYSLYQQLNV